MEKITSPQMYAYFQYLTNHVERSYQIAEAARKRGLDPENFVSIPIAKNMAERVVGLISVVAPQISGTSIPERIIELEKKYGLLDWRVALVIAEEVAQEKFCKFENKLEAMEIGIRVGFSYLTLGIVSAPLEGFIGLKIKRRRDGKEYFALQYAGPIRAAGGTGASVSVILADYVRVKMGFAPYDPDETETNRYVTEVLDYNERVTNLQYLPSSNELKFIISHLPVEVDGDPTEKFEVSNYKDLPRIETNLIRGGVALVLAEGLSQKAPKLLKKISKWGKDFDLSHWDFLEEFVKLKEEVHAGPENKEKDAKEEKRIKPNNTYISDLVAGRPILTHPLGEGGFRLRYGRGRTCGMYAVGVTPATLIVLNKYIAIGTQLKVERPRKGASVTVCDALEGPIVRLKDGSVLQLSSENQAKKINSEIETVLFLGDILFNFGDFSESGHRLVPAGYCPEWWVPELEKAISNLPKKSPLKKIAAQVEIKESRLKEIIDKPLLVFPTWEEALKISTELKVPLHPDYTFYWKLISSQEFFELKAWLSEGKIKTEQNEIKKIILPYYAKNEVHLKAKNILERLGVPHLVINKDNIVLEEKEAKILVFCFKNKEISEDSLLEKNTNKTGLDAVNLVSGITFRDKAGTFIGARMGRPEKAKMRLMTGSPQVMFPVGEEGGRLRSFQAALQVGKIRSNFPNFYCEKCQKDTIYPRCESCGDQCIKKYFCRFCGDLSKDSCRHGKAEPYKMKEIDIRYFFDQAKKLIEEKLSPDLIKGVRGTSNKEHTVEHLAKGILRAKHDLYVNKDGTIRYDATEQPLTHFKPKEIHTPLLKLKELGYINDIYGKELVDNDQILELKPQDIVLPGFDSLEESAVSVLLRVANFLDDLLVKFYKLEPFYNATVSEDLVGHLVVGLAPHTSAGIVGRIIGFSQTQCLLAHPMYHAAMRRDCDGDEAAIMLLMDPLLNFSRQYLPEKRGAKTMDAPLVLTSILYPSEVDDQVLEMDTVWKYPLELYEAALEMKMPSEVNFPEKRIERIADRLGTLRQYEQFGFTHPVDNFNNGVLCSSYKTLPTMEDKLMGQMEIAQRVRAVDKDDVARLVIEKHFLKDIKGNLKKFSMQQFRCTKCNEKFRRPPLSGKCTACSNGNLAFTISEGSVIKYLGFSLKLAEKYEFSPYLKQTLELLKVNVDHIFGKDKDKQVGLTGFIVES